MGRDSALCCSAGVDARIRRWRLPDLDMDPYDGYGGCHLPRGGDRHREEGTGVTPVTSAPQPHPITPFAPGGAAALSPPPLPLWLPPHPVPPATLR